MVNPYRPPSPQQAAPGLAPFRPRQGWWDASLAGATPPNQMSQQMVAPVGGMPPQPTVGGGAPTQWWNQVPGRTEAPGGVATANPPGGGYRYMSLAQAAPPAIPGQTTNPDGSVTTSLPGGGKPPVPTATNMPWLTQTAGQPGTEAPLGTGQPNQPPTPSGEFNAASADTWRNLAQGMIRNGWGLDPVGARQNNGIVVGYGSPYQTVIIMPTDYTYAQDTARWWVAGAGEETSMQRALRKAADELSGNPNLNSMQVLAKWMRFVDQEARKQGKSSGFNMSQMGGQGLDPNTAGKPTSATAPPPGTAPPAAPPPATGSPPTVPPGAPGTSQPPAANGPFSQAAIALGATDQRAAFDMYNQFVNGTTTSGRGPFSRFYEAWFGPVAQAVINNWSAEGKLPSVAEAVQLFQNLKNGMAGGQVNGQNVMDWLSNMGSTAVQGAIGGPAGESYQTLANAVQSANPLMSLMLNPVHRDVYYNSQEDALRELAARGYDKPDLGDAMTDWGQYFRNSDFYRRYYR